MDRELLVSVMFFGSIWGIIEALLGGFMHMVLPFFPYTGAIIISLAMPLLLAANTRGKGAVVLTGAVSASFKLLNFAIFPSISILRPMVAIMAEAVTIEVLLFIAPKARGALLGCVTALASGMLIPPIMLQRILLSAIIASLLCEATTARSEKIKPDTRGTCVLFITAIILTLLI